jgi:hypothetical protein
MPEDKNIESNEIKWKIRNLKIDTGVKLISVITVAVAVMLANNAIKDQVNKEKNQKQQEVSDDLKRSLLDMKIEAEVKFISKERSALIVTANLHNVGNEVIRPYSHADDPQPDGQKNYTSEGLTLSITSHKVDEYGVVDFQGERIVNRFNILERYEKLNNSNWNNYVMKPGDTFREAETAVVKNGYLYEVVMRFYGRSKAGTWTNTETRFFYVP